MKRLSLITICIALVFGVIPLLSQTVSTGAITGRATDSSGAVIPGVDVTITSPAMIGGARSALTDEQGMYRFTQLAPGTYRVSFELPGFKTIRIEDVDVAAGGTRTINGGLELSSTAEEITVTSQAAAIDLEQATIGVNWNQKTMEDLPWSRSITAVYQMIPGAYATSYDIGNSLFGTAGSTPRNGGRSGGNVVSYDGAMWCQTSGDYGEFEELNISTSAKGADQMNSGITINMLVKSGGNQFHGTFTAGYENGSMQSTNVDAALLAAGLPPGSNKFTHFRDLYGDIGGPVIKNKLWFYASYNDGYNGTFIPGFLTTVGGSPAEFFTKLKIPNAKLTWQLTSKQKIETHWALSRKWQPYRNGNAKTPQDATQDQDALSTQGPTLKWTDILDARSTASVQVSRGGYWWPAYAYKLPAGVGPIVGLLNGTTQPLPTVNGVGVRITDSTSGATDGGFLPNYARPIRWQWNADISRIMPIAGRSNEIKAGYFGWWDKSYTSNFGYPYAELYTYKSLPNETCPGNVICSNYFLHPNSVTVYDYPNRTSAGGKYKGFYLNDRITMSRRATLNVGLRYDWATSFLPPQGNDGSGAYATNYQIPYNGKDNQGNLYAFPVYHLWSPRISFAYDLTGSGRFALKASYGRYVGMDSSPNSQPAPGANSSGVNPISTRACKYNNWNGVIPFDPRSDFGPDGLMGTADDLNLAAACPGSGSNGIHNFDPGLKPAYLDEYTAGVDVGLTRNYSIRANVSRKFDKGGSKQLNVLLPYSAYTDVRCTTDPGMDGKPGTADDNPFGPVCTYSVPNSNPNRTVTNVTFANVDTNAHENQAMYTAYNFTLNKAYSDNWSFLGGYGIDLARPGVTNPLTPDAALYNQNSTVPVWSQEIKMNGIYGLPGIPLFGKRLTGVQWSSTYTAQSGDWYNRSAQVVNALGTTVVQTVQPHVGRYPWVKVWDQRISKKFKIGDRQSLELKWDQFNLTNANTVTTWQSTNSNSSTYLQPNGAPFAPATILTPRIYQWGATYRF